MATMSVACQCGRTLSVSAELAGRRAQCPACGQDFQVPIPSITKRTEQITRTGIQPQVQALSPPPILASPLQLIPTRETRSQLWAQLSLPVWITVGVLNLCIIGIAISVILALRSPQQAVPPPGPAVVQSPTPSPAQPAQKAKPVSPVLPQAQADPAWIGKLVVQKYADFKLQAGNQLVDLKGRFYFYRVEQTNGPSVQLKAEKGGPSGRATADQVILIEQGANFFSNQIHANPSNGFSYAMRGILWDAKGEHDIAITDFNEAIRLDGPRAGS